MRFMQSCSFTKHCSIFNYCFNFIKIQNNICLPVLVSRGPEIQHGEVDPSGRSFPCVASTARFSYNWALESY